MVSRETAEEMNQLAMALEDRGEREEAIELYTKAARLDPGWSVPLYNLGLLFKRQRCWKESFRYNRRATELNPRDEAAWWNLGIAATALRRWKSARAAWQGYGIPVPDGRGPINFPCGYCPIRLDPDGSPEVVWAYRLDPARAEIASIPLPDSGHRWRDIVLNDGAPRGYRRSGGKDVPVFDELELFEPSRYGTFVARVKMPHKEKYTEELARIAGERDGSAEDWTTSTQVLCKACSEGRPHDHHDQDAKPPADGIHLIGIAARDRKHATDILHAWESGLDDVQVESLGDALEPGS